MTAAGVLALCYVVEIVGVAVLAFVVPHRPGQRRHCCSAVAVLFGAARAFLPAGLRRRLGPMLVPRALLPRAIAWNSLAGQTASIAGPAVRRPAGRALAGRRLCRGARPLCRRRRCASLFDPPHRRSRRAQPGSRLELVKEGLAYVAYQQGGAGRDLARPGRGAAGRRDGAAAGLRPRCPACRTGGLRPAAHGPGAGGDGRRPMARVRGRSASKAGVDHARRASPYSASPRWCSGSSRLLCPVAARPGGAGRGGHAERLRAPDPGPAGHPRRHARPRGGGLDPVHLGASNELGEFESGLAARFLGAVGAAVFGGFGARSSPAALGDPVSGLAQGRPPRISDSAAKHQTRAARSTRHGHSERQGGSGHRRRQRHRPRLRPDRGPGRGQGGGQRPGRRPARRRRRLGRSGRDGGPGDPRRRRRGGLQLRQRHLAQGLPGHAASRRSTRSAACMR